MQIVTLWGTGCWDFNIRIWGEGAQFSPEHHPWTKFRDFPLPLVNHQDSPYGCQLGEVYSTKTLTALVGHFNSLWSSATLLSPGLDPQFLQPYQESWWELPCVQCTVPPTTLEGVSIASWAVNELASNPNFSATFSDHS